MKKICIITVLGLFATSSFAQRGQVREAIHDKYESEQGAEGNGALNQWLYGNLMNVKVEPKYTFPITLTMHITNYKNGEKKDENDMNYFFNITAKTFGATIPAKGKSDEMITVYDYTQNAMVMLHPKDKTAMAFTLNAFMSKETQDKMKSGEYYENKKTDNECKKTGKTKMIQGYNCEEYVCINEEKKTKSEIWICPTLFNQNIGASLKLPVANPLLALGVSGMVMEMTSYKNEKIELKMEVTQLNKNANYTLSTEGYSINGK